MTIFVVKESGASGNAHLEPEGWKGFKKGKWCERIDVANFIEKNVTPL